MLAENRIDALMLMSGTSLAYFTNIRWWGGERPFALDSSGERQGLLSVCPAFERDRAAEVIDQSPFAGVADIRVWEEDENPYLLIAEGIRERGLAAGAWEWRRRFTRVFSDGVGKASPAPNILSGPLSHASL